MYYTFQLPSHSRTRHQNRRHRNTIRQPSSVKWAATPSPRSCGNSTRRIWNVSSLLWQTRDSCAKMSFCRRICCVAKQKTTKAHRGKRECVQECFENLFSGEKEIWKSVREYYVHVWNAEFKDIWISAVSFCSYFVLKIIPNRIVKTGASNISCLLPYLKSFYLNISRYILRSTYFV